MAAKGGNTASALGLLTLRIGAAGMLIVGHGWPKLQHFSERAHKFADPLHVGTQNSLAMAVFAELVCATFVLFGYLTRFAVVPILVLFGVIIFVVSGGEPLADRDLAIVYATAFVSIALLGPGRFSVDGARGRA